VETYPKQFRRIQYISNVVVTKVLQPGTIESSVHTSLGIVWAAKKKVEAIGGADYYEG